jgi:hypothetical protein
VNLAGLSSERLSQLQKTVHSILAEDTSVSVDDDGYLKVV